MNGIAMGENQVAKRLTVKVIVDNCVDVFLDDRVPLSYPHPGPLSGLLAEQGLSLWVETEGVDGTVRKVLYDFGRSGNVLQQNMKLLDLSLPMADFLVLSHGHIDHYGGLLQTVSRERPGIPLVAHPSAFGVRGIRRPEGDLVGPWTLDRGTVETALERKVVPSENPVTLGPGLWTSGAIPRVSDLDPVFSEAVRLKDNQWQADSFEDDLALFARVKNFGLVVLTGCCHAGLFNTLHAARGMFSNTPIGAAIGGFHLNFLGADRLDRIMAALEPWDISCLAPLHCTGSLAKHHLRAHFGDSFAFATVGMVATFSGKDA